MDVVVGRFLAVLAILFLGFLLQANLADTNGKCGAGKRGVVSRPFGGSSGAGLPPFLGRAKQATRPEAREREHQRRLPKLVSLSRNLSGVRKDGESMGAGGMLKAYLE
ncbi:MAG: hypothetical protein M2R45_03666 [Verrucomicrobia subdivision 3 bacterium]|nr:hypothetical protein [Limisphaerales bacterium]MCS1412705.1 hypothetical protein [Limisphaerales bacterium]